MRLPSSAILLPFFLLLPSGTLTFQAQAQTQPSQEPSIISSSPCTDESLTWTDGSPDTNPCKWYSVNNRCTLYGNESPNPFTNTTANEACCICGGGSTGNNINLATPSRSPSTSLSPTELCVDVPGWEDSAGDTCVYYDDNQENGACEAYGDCCINMGHTANSACCACEGGFRRGADGLVHLPSSTPSIVFAPSDRPSVSTRPSISALPSKMITVSPTELPTLFPSQSEAQQVVMFSAPSGRPVVVSSSSPPLLLSSRRRRMNASSLLSYGSIASTSVWMVLG